MAGKRNKIFKSTSDLAPDEIHSLYAGFDCPLVELDCGKKCAPHNPGGKPFCCDICQAVPAAYKSEWEYLQPNTDLWHVWQGDECQESNPQDHARLQGATPANMLLLACLGPDRCQRNFRALSCRQFPFFPYVTSSYRFIGLAYEWEFEARCWVISNLAQVTSHYREAFLRTYDCLFVLFQEEFEQYAYHSERLRLKFLRRRRRFPLLHREGGYYLVSPGSERLERIRPENLPRFGVYQGATA
jgi:hypothetical protein